MEEVRKSHNFAKRTLIQNAVKMSKAKCILDVGFGRGGDLQKWKAAGVRIDACEPDEESLIEATNRAHNMGIKTNLFKGDISVCPHKKYDIICYNFSIQYIFENGGLFFRTLKEIKKRMRPGGILIGCIPDSEQILINTPFKDSMGNFMTRKDDTGYGAFGEKLYVQLTDTPYYSDGPIAEPIAYKDLLITHLELLGIHLESWTPLGPDHEISQLYSKFIFRNVM